MIAIICLSSGVILNAAMGKYKGKGGSEQGLFRQLLDSLNAGDVLLADRYYTSYFLVAMLMNKGVDIIFQQHATRKTDFRKGRQLGERDHIACWKKPKTQPDWMSKEQFDSFPNELLLAFGYIGLIYLKIITDTMLSVDLFYTLYCQLT